jgi:DNA-binding NarL/FixJ family response regulator
VAGVQRPIRILLVEDNDVFREALELLLQLRADTDVVATVSDGAEAVEACRRSGPDVVVVDYRLPALDGVETTAAIRRACPGAAVVCLTAEVTPAEERAILSAGAAECLSKDAELEAIVAGIRRAARRERAA